MSLSIDRGMVVQAVLEGRIGVEHVTVDELVQAHHLLADATMAQCLQDQLSRPDVTVFVLEWQYVTPH